MEFWGAILKNKNGDLGLALAPGWLQEVKRVEFSPHSGAVGVVLEGEQNARPVGFLPQSFDEAAIRAADVLIGHFESMADFATYETCREYRAAMCIV